MKTLTKAGGDDRGTDPRLVKLQDALTNTKGDKLVAPPQISKKGNDTVFTVIATTAPSAPATVDLVKRLRDNVIPNATGKGIVAFVGGSTASNVDLAAEISNRLPLVIITILLLSMLVLLVAFRSLLIPLQAAATNLLTALAAFGIVTAVLPVGLGHRHHRRRHHRRLGADRQLRAADDVRDAVRPEHGLPGVPALVRRPLPRGGRGRPQRRSAPACTPRRA